MQMNLESRELRQRVRRQSTLMKVNAWIDWEALRSSVKAWISAINAVQADKKPLMAC